MKSNALLKQALQLRPAQKFIVIEALINSLDLPNPEIEQAWAKEAQKRLRLYRQGKLKTIDLARLVA